MQMVHEKLRHCCNTVFQSFIRNDQADDRFGLRNQFQRQLCDDSQCSFRSDHQIQQAVSGTGFRNCRPQFDNLTCGKNDGHRPDIISRRTVFYCPHAAGIGCYISAYGRKFFSRVRRIQKPLFFCIFRQVI